MTECPTFIIFCGINGAGKSTFHRSGLWRQVGIPTSERISPDEILRAAGEDPSDVSAQVRAGKPSITAHGRCWRAGRTRRRGSGLASYPPTRSCYNAAK